MTDIGRLQDLYENAVECRADCDEDTPLYRLLDDVVSKLSEALRIARDA
jgi:hypothetical protein